MSKLTDLITALFGGDQAIVNSDGQRTIALEPVLKEVEGLVLFDEVDPTITEPTTVVEAVQGVSREELTAVIDRLISLEQLISAVDNVTQEIPTEKEIW